MKICLSTALFSILQFLKAVTILLSQRLKPQSQFEFCLTVWQSFGLWSLSDLAWEQHMGLTA